MQYDAVIIGSGPNGLSAGILLASRGLRVLIMEAADEAGGGTRTSELTLPGFRHDVCSAVHPMGYLSPFFRQLKLENYGLKWVFPDASVAHPLDGEQAVILSRSIEETAENLGVDQKAYRKLIAPFENKEDELFGDILKPLGIPDHPLLMARFGLMALLPAQTFASLFFKGQRAKALFAGCAAHSTVPFDKFFTSAMGIVFLISGHAANWPVARGGSQAIAEALLKVFREKGGELQLSTKIRQFGELPPARAYLFDTDPLQLAHIAEEQLPASYIRRLKKFNYGPGIFKVDYALSEPVPWSDPRCLKASTVHVGGPFDEVAMGEKEVWNGKHSDRPFVLVAQQSLFDQTRSPAGKHTFWAYCHVPFGSTKDMSEVIENQIERFAPGFRDTIIEKHTMNTTAFHRYNPNYLGGVISGGSTDITQLFTRPVARLDPYTTPNPKLFICSASTPPGGGVHGMCGYHAAKSVLKKLGYEDSR